MSAWTARHAGRAAGRRGKPARRATSRSAGTPAASRGEASPPRGLGSTWSTTLAILFAIAFGWRLAYILRLAATPLGGSLTEDAQFYWTWSAHLLRHGFVGSNPFFLAPLYPYVLAPLRLALGDSVQRVLIVQAVWGAAAAVLLADAARRMTRPGVGLVVGVLAAFYENAVFFDGLVLTESLLFFLESLLVWWIAARGARAPRAWVAAVAGVLVGVIAEGRATSSLLLLPAAVWIAHAARTGEDGPAEHERGTDAARSRAPLGPALPGIAALAAGFLLVTTPVAIRNYAVGHEWIPFTYNLGYNA
ncbi:MAG TPA: glycosyltransferase family 39 protein, partial [Dongiaceae bacterium]|nr:glycosyltransferase family 39 protein [Dongiaceae bacterium]